MSRSRSDRVGRRMSPTLAALLVGLPLAAGILALFHYGPLQHSVAARYVTHPVQWAEVAMFCTAVGALLVKWWHNRSEAEVCTLDILPRWDGVAVPVSEAPALLSALRRLTARLQGTLLARRMANILEFVCQRRSTAELDDQMRALSDNDAMAQDASFSLVRFITWAIPILGFLGTVLGITTAIAGVNPEQMEDTLGQITGGLAEAFDSTALALGLTMVAMFLTFLVERQEQAVLEAIDRVIDRQLAHRFLREGASEGPFAEMLRQQTQVLVQSIEALVGKQAQLWADALQEPERRANEAHARTLEQLTSALRIVLDQTLQNHAQRLLEMERQAAENTAQLVQQLKSVAASVQDTGREQQAALIKVAESVASQASVLGELQQDATNLVHLQAVLHQNLAALAGAGSFEQAVHTLTAAVHLLTSRASAQPHSQGWGRIERAA